MKKIVVLLAVTLLMFGGLVFSEGSKETGNEVLELKLPHPDTVSGTLNRTTEYFADQVNELSDGKIEVTVFPAGQLGNHDELAEACVLGNMPLVKLTMGVMTHYDEAMNILDLPFLFKNEDHVEAVMKSPSVQKLFEEFTEKSGLRILAIYGSGFQGFYSNKAIKTIDDIKGMTMRVMNSPARISSMEAYGALAVNVPWTEAYAAFQQGVADGGENSLPLVLNSKQYEVLNYYTVSNHFYSANAIVINEKYFQNLTDEQQEVLLEAGQLAIPYNREIYDEELALARTKLEEFGVEIYDMPEADRSEFVESVYPVWEQYAKTDLQKQILVDIKEIGENY